MIPYREVLGLYQSRLLQRERPIGRLWLYVIPHIELRTQKLDLNPV